MRYLTQQHQTPPRVIELDGIQYPVTRLIELEDTETLIVLGIYPHIYLDPSIPAPLGTEWQYNYTEAQWEQVPAGTELQRAEVVFKQQASAEYRARTTSSANKTLADSDATPTDKVAALSTLTQLGAF